MNTKLTLSVDPEVVAAAKRYAANTGTSVSRLVERYLIALAAKPTVTPTTPVLARLRGCLRDVDVVDHQRFVEEKYR